MCELMPISFSFIHSAGQEAVSSYYVLKKTESKKYLETNETVNKKYQNLWDRSSSKDIYNDKHLH